MSQNQLITQLPGLGLWYPHIAGSGSTVYDYSGNSNNGTITNGTWKKNTNGLYSLDYSSGYTSISNASTFKYTNNFTILMWVNLDSASAFNTFWSSTLDPNGGGNFSGISFAHNASAQVDFFHPTDGSNFVRATSTATLSTGVWYFIGCTKSSTNGLKIFINGVVDGTNVNTSDVHYDATTPYAYIGARNNDGVVESYIDGQITGAVVCDSVLSEELIAQIYRKTFIT